MKTLVLFLFLPSFYGTTQVNLDSLWNVWNDHQQSDTNRLKAIYLYAYNGYLFSKPDSAYYFAHLQYDLANSIHDNEHMAKACYVKGLTHYIKSDFSTALDYLRESLALSQLTGNKKSIAKYLYGIGSCYQFQGKIDSAIEFFSQTIRVSESISDYQSAGDAFNNLGGINQDSGNYEEATRYYMLGLKNNEKSGDKSSVGTSLNNIGLIYKVLGDYSKAIEYYTRSLRYFNDLGNIHGTGSTLTNLGNIYLAQGDPVKAIEYYQKALVLLEKSLVSLRNVAGLLNNLGLTFYESGDHETAIDYFNRSLKIKEETGDKKGRAITLLNIGTVYQAQARYSQAIDLYGQALMLAEQLGDKNTICRALTCLGVVHQSTDNLVTAFHCYRRGLYIALELKAVEEISASHRGMFSAYCMADSLAEAIKSITALLDQNDRSIELNYPVLTEEQKNKYFETMSEDYDLYYDVALHLEDTLESITERSFDNCLKIKGNLLKSSTAMRNAILSSGDSALIKRYYDWIVLQRIIVKAYAQGTDLKHLEDHANELEKELVRGSNDFSDLVRFQHLSWKNVQATLQENESAVEFIRFAHVEDYKKDSLKEILYCALIVKKYSRHPEMIRLFAEPELEKIIGTFPGNNLSYIDQVYGNKENTKSQLYDLIWKPMEKSLEGVKKVYVSPVGLLHKISFSALAKEQDVFLCDVHEIEMQSSTGNIAMKTADVKFNGTEQTTIFGGIDYNSDSSSSVVWNYLDGSLTETQKIEKILKKDGQNVSYYNLSSATEEQFKKTASESNILHIATHGFFYADPDEAMASAVDETESSSDLTFRGGTSGFGVHSFVKSRNPLMRSGLVFAGANDVWNRSTSTDDPMAIGFENIDSTYKEDGVLTAAEVATIDMRKTQLVVLSACETGLGDIKGSEGVYGLQRAFKMAGVKYIIMSLWQVPDKETSEFMTLFYKNLTKVSDIRKAFTMTQKTMRDKYDPYYWGAFVLIE